MFPNCTKSRRVTGTLSRRTLDAITETVSRYVVDYARWINAEGHPKRASTDRLEFVPQKRAGSGRAARYWKFDTDLSIDHRAGQRYTGSEAGRLHQVTTSMTTLWRRPPPVS
ncbi:hypothetical protein KM043_009885 [Ampulex compressa]|nr:hypothetical protein KM043_009885 [Ampulex compressa]